RQTDSIHALGGQLDNISRLVVNLSLRVSLLQSQVSDRQSYLLLSLLLCVVLGTVVVANHLTGSSSSAPSLPTPPPLPPTPPLSPPPPSTTTTTTTGTTATCPEARAKSPVEELQQLLLPREQKEQGFPSVCDDELVARRSSCPLLRCDSVQQGAVKDPQDPRGDLCTNGRTVVAQKRRKASVPTESTTAPYVETPAPPGGLLLPPLTCNGALPWRPATHAVRTLRPAFMDYRSEGSSEGSSSHSDEPSFCGVAAGVCTRGLCQGPPPLPPATAAGAPPPPLLLQPRPPGSSPPAAAAAAAAAASTCLARPCRSCSDRESNPHTCCSLRPGARGDDEWRPATG
ncbi:hypothetical protein CRUP_017820, partial [Coryphaenoides rupestris]